jgi:P4 family phage/plasmid primase-like protien
MTNTPDPIVSLVARALAALLPAGQTTELRAPNAKGKGDFTATMSGYFDSIPKLVEASRTIDAPGVYMVLNPVDPSLLARCNNRVKKMVKGDASTTDADILCRRWLFVEVDPVRKSGICATDAEKGEALAVADAVLTHLRGEGWPEPMQIDSGNGYYLLFRVDLPTDDDGLSARCLKALASRFDTQTAHVDTTVFNPARIARLPGSWNKKGDRTPDRPHRKCVPVSVPDQLKAVPVELLEALAGTAPVTERRAAAGAGGGSSDEFEHRLLVPEYLSEFGVNVLGSGTGDKGQTKWWVTCPFNQDHAGKDAFVFQYPDGAVGFKCSHNSCAGNEWDEFKEVVGKPRPEQYDPPMLAKGMVSPDGKAPVSLASLGDLVELPDSEPLPPPPPPAPPLQPLAPRPVSPTPPVSPPPSGGPDGPEPGRPGLASGVKGDNPGYLADLFLFNHRHPDGDTIRYWNDQWYRWSDGVYEMLRPSQIETIAGQSTADEFDRQHATIQSNPRIQEQMAAGATPSRLTGHKLEVTVPLVRNVLFNARSKATVHSKIEPCWVDCDNPPAGTMIAFPNGILDLAAHLRGDVNCFTPTTPRYFTRSRLDFNYDPNPPTPKRWFAFLRQIWPTISQSDRDSIALLQQWFGYVLSGDNSRQKYLMMIGAPNGGKGVINDVLRGLVGTAVTCTPTLHTLSGDFGLAALDGKSLAIVGDMRTYPRTDVSIAVERILNITGGDFSTINAKNKAEYEAKLSNRFVFASNGLPKLFDTSAALIRRTLMLQFTIGFDGNPDTTLGEKLRAELPGIFAWAIDGLRSLNERNKFTQPENGQKLIDQFKELMSSPANYVKERCVLDPAAFETYDALYEDWKDWCGNDEGKNGVGSKSEFKAKLLEVVPTLTDGRPEVNNPTRKRGYFGIRLIQSHELSKLP